MKLPHRCGVELGEGAFVPLVVSAKLEFGRYSGQVPRNFNPILVFEWMMSSKLGMFAPRICGHGDVRKSMCRILVLN